MKLKKQLYFLTLEITYNFFNMKKILLIILTTSFLLSCKSEEEKKSDKMQLAITNKLKESMKNPDSFEFVSMKITDIFTKKQRSEIINIESLNKIKELGVESLIFQTQKEYDFIQKTPNDKDEVTYYVEFIAKGTNSFGATIQTTYSATVLNDNDFTVFSVKEMN